MADNIVILTGAGISAESGIPVFRAESGLWEQHRVEDVATPEGFARDPKLVHEFYNGMRRKLPEKKPNAAHLALARLQREWPQRHGGTVTLVTQNIDDLHERAGSPAVIHMHGELMSIWCTRCGARYPFTGDSGPESVCARCGHAGGLRPDIVWFGEMPYRMAEIEAALRDCRRFLSVGTSGVVYPAAGFCHAAKAAGSTCVEFNLSGSATASAFDRGVYGKATATLPPFVEQLLAQGQA